MERSVDATHAVGQQLAAHFSIIDLFMNADLIGKSVMIALVLASIWSWTVIIDKLLRMRRVRGQASQFEEQFWSGGSLEDLYDVVSRKPADPITAMFVAAMREWRRAAARSQINLARANLQDRIERAMDVTLGREMERLERFMTVLASIGSIAPFVGLFGTVWGIMNSFQAIAARGNTSLAVVAPGIAEALFATALGLFAAIPAVIFYNKLQSDLTRFQGRLEAFQGEFSTLLSRQLDEKSAG